jgi:hypothetical protein
MAFVDIVPISGSIISRGAIITVRWDTAALPNITYRPTSGPDEIISAPATSGAKLGSGYTGEYGVDVSGPTPIYSIAFKRDAGWTNSGFVISVFDFWTGTDTLSNYTILAEGQYPPDMQPFTDPAEGAGEGTIQVLNSGVLLGSAASINFDDNLVAVLNGDTATVDGEAGGGGSTVGSVSGTIGIWSKGNTVTDPFDVLTTGQNFDVNDGSPFSTTKIRVASVVPLEGIQAYLTLGNLPPGYMSFQDKTDPGVTATTFEILSVTATGGSYADLTVNYVAGSAGAWSTNPYILVFTPKAVPGGVVDFTDLADVTQSYSGAAGHLVRVNAGEFGLEYVAPGTVAGGEEVVASVATDGSGGANVSASSVGVSSADVGLGHVRLTWSTPFDNADYFIQLTNSDPVTPRQGNRYRVGDRTTSHADIVAWDSSDNLLDSSTELLRFEIIAQDGPSAGNTGRGMASFAYTGSGIPGEFSSTGGTLGSDITELGFGWLDDVGEEVEKSMIATQEGDIIWLRARSTQKFFAWTMTISQSGPGAVYGGLVSVDGGANDLVFGETYDVGFVESGATGGGDTDLNSVLTVAPINNVVNVSVGDPIILRDGGDSAVTPLTVTKLASSTTVPVLELAVNQPQALAMRIFAASTGGGIGFAGSGITHEGDTDDPISFGGIITNPNVTAAAGDVTVSGIYTALQDSDGGKVMIRGGDNFNGTSGDGGDVELLAGSFAVSGVNGTIYIGRQSPNEIVFGQGFSMDESATPPLATTGTGKGQFWVNEGTTPNKPYFTNEDDIDIDLTAGSGVGDVTSSSAITANKIVIGDDGAKGVKEAPLGSLSDAGALTAIATIDTTGDITAGADLIATTALDVGTSAVIATDLTMTTGDIIMSAGATVDGIDVGTAVAANTAHKDTTDGTNPHAVEGTNILSTAEGADSFLSSTAGGISAWIDATAAAALLDHADLGLGLGTNTHAQIDNHINDMANPHGTDFGDLTPATLVQFNDWAADFEVADTESVASLPAPGIAGRYRWRTSDDTFHHDNGTAWVNITETAGGLTGVNGPLAGEWAKFVTAGTVEGRTTAELLADMSIDEDITTLTIGASALVTGNNTGDQTITLTGDVEGSGVGSFEALIADDAVDFDAMAHSTAGSVIIYDASGVPTTSGAGTAKQVLTSNGTSAPTFETTHRLTKSITIEDPAANENIKMFYTNVAITVTQLTAVIVGGTSVSYDIQHGTSRATATGTGVVGTDVLVNNTTVGIKTTSFTDATIPLDSHIWLTTSALDGGVTEFSVTLEYTED